MDDPLKKLPRAKVEKSYLSKALWLIPLAAAAICAYFLLHDYVFSGPTVTIYFLNGDGLQEKNSLVKYLGIKIGEVEGVRMAKNGHQVIVKAKLDRSAANLARIGSRFWIVRPEIKLGAIRGLRTIVAGDYLTVAPGDGARTNTFVGLEQPPIVPVKAIHITLLTHDLGAIQPQSPVYYGGIQVGEVLDCHLADDASTILIEARIRQDYAPLVRVDSKFWNAGGLNIHAGLLSGLNISAESTESIISGGVAFATPMDYGPPATNGTIFSLYAKEDDSWKDWWPPIPLQKVPPAEQKKSNVPKINFP